VRPPYGNVTLEQLLYLQSNGYFIVNWCVDSMDWTAENKYDILVHSLPDVSRDAIILMHSAGDTGENLQPTINVLPDLIYTLKLQGYKFVTIDELIKIPAYF